MGQNEKDGIEKEDCISALPNDILIHILSLLTVNEAQKTSILSRRWRFLWTLITSLDFTVDLDKVAYKISKFIDWVDKVCSSIQSPSIQHFKIHYHWFAETTHTFDKWVAFAMEKQVENLYLFMYKYPDQWTLSYSPVSPISSFKPLRSLSFQYINVSGESIEHFLLHCPLLEKLSIEKSEHLQTLKVEGPLTFLKIIDCNSLTDLLLCAPKLSEFRFKGNRINLQIDENYVPSLSHLYICGENVDDCLTWAFYALSSQLSQLQTLEISLEFNRICSCEFDCCAWGEMEFSPFSKLSSLRELTMNGTGDNDERLIFLLSMLNVCPFLTKIKFGNESILLEGDRNDLLEETWFTVNPHHYLKVIEVFGFFNRLNIVKFVKHLYKAPLTLEKVIIDPIPSWKLYKPQCERIICTKQFEEQFEEVLSSDISRPIEFIL